MTNYSMDTTGKLLFISNMRLSVVFMYLTLSLVCRVTSANTLTSEEIAKSALDATVLLVMVDDNGEVSSAGSGFFVFSNLIATNFHVIDGASGVGARSVGEETIYPIEQIRAVDEENDLAILQVSAPEILPLPLGDSESVAVGEKIYVSGNPLGVLEGTFSDGMISAIRGQGAEKLLQVTAPISVGNSGGPVLNTRGEVIGVLKGTIPAGQNLNFAIPSIYLKALVEKVIGKQLVIPIFEPHEPPPPVTPSHPVTPAYQEMLEKGIELFEQSQFQEAINALRSATRELTDPNQRAIAHIYLGCARRGFGESDHSVSVEFEDALRHNPNQTLPSRLGEDHPVFKSLLEKVRSESTGELTVNGSLPQTEIWIDGEEIGRKMIGTGTARVRLFKGVYTAEGVYQDAFRKKTVQVEPYEHEELYLELPPILRHSPSSRVSVGEIIPIALDLTIHEPPERIQISYIIFDKHGVNLKRDNEEMHLWDVQPELSTWIYLADLPAQEHVGKIAYFIMSDAGRSPNSQFHEIAIVDKNVPEINLLEPQVSSEFKVNQSILVKARVTDNSSVDEAQVHYVFTKLASTRPSGTLPSLPLAREVSSDIYVGEIPAQRNAPGFVWCYVTAIDESNNQRQSDVRRIRIVPPPDVRPPISPRSEDSTSEHLLHQGLWASHGWAADVQRNDRSVSSWDRGDLVRLSYLSEGKGYQTVSVKLDYSYQFTDNINATIEWGPAIKDGPIAFAILGGVARYSNADSRLIEASHGARIALDNPIQTTPFLGASLKLYPLNTVTVDVAGSIKLKSIDTFSRGEFNSIEEHLQHYEMGIRFYVTPRLNLRVGYGNWYLENHGSESVQIGMGLTF